MTNKSKKAFTLIELMVAMGVLAVLAGLTIFGIQAVLKSQRDTQRRNNATNLQLEVQGYQNTYKVYPATADMTIQGSTITVRQPGGGPTYSTINLDGPAASNLSTTSARSAYCYQSTSGVTYRLGLMNETGTWEQFGNDTTACTSITSTP